MLKATPRGCIEQAWNRKETRTSGNRSVGGLPQVSEPSCRSMCAVPAGLWALSIR